MQEMKDDHRGHAIITSVSGPDLKTGPFIASYTVWKIEPNNSYRAVLQGALPNAFEASESARAGAMLEAKEKLDTILNKQ
jgi:hypothetical protein